MTDDGKFARPAPALAWTACVVVVVATGFLRLVVFHHIIMPLSYAVPLLLCVWTRDKRMLWGMAALFAVFATLKIFWIMPEDALTPFQDWAAYLSQIINVAIAAAVIHAIINLRASLEHKNALLAEYNEHLAKVKDQIASENESLRKIVPLQGAGHS